MQKAIKHYRLYPSYINCEYKMDLNPLNFEFRSRCLRICTVTRNNDQAVVNIGLFESSSGERPRPYSEDYGWRLAEINVEIQSGQRCSAQRWPGLRDNMITCILVNQLFDVHGACALQKIIMAEATTLSRFSGCLRDFLFDSLAHKEYMHSAQSRSWISSSNESPITEKKKCDSAITRAANSADINETSTNEEEEDGQQCLDPLAHSDENGKNATFKNDTQDELETFKRCIVFLLLMLTSFTIHLHNICKTTRLHKNLIVFLWLFSSFSSASSPDEGETKIFQTFVNTSCNREQLHNDICAPLPNVKMLKTLCQFKCKDGERPECIPVGRTRSVHICVPVNNVIPPGYMWEANILEQNISGVVIQQKECPPDFVPWYRSYSTASCGKGVSSDGTQSMNTKLIQTTNAVTPTVMTRRFRNVTANNTTDPTKRKTEFEANEANDSSSDDHTSSLTIGLVILASVISLAVFGFCVYTFQEMKNKRNRRTQGERSPETQPLAQDARENSEETQIPPQANTVADVNVISFMEDCCIEKDFKHRGETTGLRETIRSKKLTNNMERNINLTIHANSGTCVVNVLNSEDASDPSSGAPMDLEGASNGDDQTARKEVMEEISERYSEENDNHGASDIHLGNTTKISTDPIDHIPALSSLKDSKRTRCMSE